MDKKIMLLFVAALAVPVPAMAEISINVNIGGPSVVFPGPAPSPRVVVAPPRIRFEAPPLFLSPSQFGFYVGVGVPYDIFFSGQDYYLYYGNSWYRSGYYNGPWLGMERRHLPPGLRKHRVEHIRTYRDREYRAYNRQRDHYRGRHFRPDSDRKEHIREERKHDKREMKEDRKREKKEWKDDRRGHGRRD